MQSCYAQVGLAFIFYCDFRALFFPRRFGQLGAKSIEWGNQYSMLHTGKYAGDIAVGVVMRFAWRWNELIGIIMKPQILRDDGLNPRERTKEVSVYLWKRGNSILFYQVILTFSLSLCGRGIILCSMKQVRMGWGLTLAPLIFRTYVAVASPAF